MKQSCTGIILSAVIIIFLSACVSSTSIYDDTKAQTWTGEITGMAAGKMKMQAWQLTNMPGRHETKSTVSLTIVQTLRGYTGTMEGTLKGFITNGRFEGTLSGEIIVQEGSSPLTGTFTGEFTDSTGSGTWVMTPQKDMSLKYSGEWTLQKQ